MVKPGVAEDPSVRACVCDLSRKEQHRPLLPMTQEDGFLCWIYSLTD